MSLETANTIATVVSSVAAFITILLVIKQYNDSKKSETKHFWFRNYILDNNFKECENIFENILSIFKSTTLEEVEKLIKLKEEFNNLREYFYKTKFFDEKLYENLDNFINLCEEECISGFNSIDNDDIYRMKNIFLKSLFEYELSDYKNFTIKYK